MAKQTLLQKAKAVKVTNKVQRTVDDIELALAWVKSEVRLKQVMEAYGCGHTVAYSRLALSLKQHLNKRP